MIEARTMTETGRTMRKRRDAERRERPLVLVVEDDPHDRDIYGMMLCYNGFDVAFAGNARDGLAAARKHRPDLILLDLGLPDGDGLELCTTLRAESTQPPPVVVLSGFTEARVGESARLAGCTRFLEKPTNPVHVLHEIENLIGKAPLSGVGHPPRVLDAPVS